MKEERKDIYERVTGLNHIGTGERRAAMDAAMERGACSRED